MKKSAFGYFMAVFTIMMWSMNIIYAKYLAGIFFPAEISFYRWFFALFIMIPLSWKALQRQKKRIFKHWKLVILMALTGLGVQNWLIYCAGYTASATNMSLISILGPIFLILISHQKLNFWQIMGILCAVFGVVMIILHGHLSNLKTFQVVPGDFYMLGSAFLFSIYSALQRHTPNDISPTALLTAGIVVSTIIFIPFALPEIIHTSTRHIPWIAWAILIVLGVINSALGYLSWDMAIQKIGTVNAGTLYYIMPIFSITAAYFILHEQIYESQLWGALLIVAGVVGVIFGSRQKSSVDNS